MSPRFLLDTNVISEPLRPKPHPAVLEKLRQNQMELAISTITWHELWFGCQRLPASIRRSAIERYLLEVVAPSMPILAYDQSAAEWHASERARLVAAGRTPPFADGQIAAIAHQFNLLLVTFNTADYIAFQDIQLQDWRD
jgi:tRNA(fMet)-specific endonuclease VapC